MGSFERSSETGAVDGGFGVACVNVAIKHKAVAVKTTSGFDFMNSFLLLLKVNCDPTHRSVNVGLRLLPNSTCSIS
ncbi:MAG: hypothetical protein NTU70_05930 [Methylococcales bacterium]|nr:hypothetical protein [Methylococcales bacterium]